MFRSEENYLKSIYQLTIEQNRKLVTTNELASMLGYSDQSTNEMIKKLETKNYVVFEPYKGIRLTDQGKNEAIRMVRAHRLWEVFLLQKLDFDWSHLHHDAEELEHASSPEVIEHLYNFLGRPQYCSHGNPIPDSDGKVGPLATKKLSTFKEGERFVIKRVLDMKELLDYLSLNNLGINSVLEIKERNDFAEYLTVLADGVLLQITYPVAERIFTL